MPCYHPIDGFICQDGKFRVWPRESMRLRKQTIPCGQCVGCRLERSRQWAIRCLHEASLYKHNCFITLTYKPELLPIDNSLDYTHFQEFMKRLRESQVGCDLVSHPSAGEINNKTGKPYPDFYKPIRFYMCGEYGKNRGRPHFHACLFNFDFFDKTFWRKTPQGHPIWRSKILEDLWPYGFSEIGSVSFQSAAYVARYIMKKANGAAADDVYSWTDPVTGEVFDRTPEFTKMSLKPGIAEGWLRKYMTDVFPHDYVVVNGKRCKPPRYYDRLFERYCNEHSWREIAELYGESDFDDVKFQRELNAMEHLEDATPERLYTRELVVKDKLSRLKRSLL